MHSSIFPSNLVYSLYWQCFPLVITVFCVIVSCSPHSLRVWESFSLCTSASFVPLWAEGSDNIVKVSCIELRNMTHTESLRNIFSCFSDRDLAWGQGPFLPAESPALTLSSPYCDCSVFSHQTFSLSFSFSRRLVSSSFWIDLFLLCVLWLTSYNVSLWYIRHNEILLLVLCNGHNYGD